MSGGSFNYLCHKVASDLLQGGREDLEHMIDALAALGYAPDAARESATVLAEVRAVEVRLDAQLQRLSGVWRAMEWWQSCDTSEQDFKRALAEYRGAELPTCSRCGGSGREPDSRFLACQNPGCANGKDTASIGLDSASTRKQQP